ncbi:twin-arginine translocase TatA/TatE family subunit [Polaribacter sp. R2A056_3_33]|uniref:twin-arginine translocase TatA/TatE family subunit n=1 Tax=Polaribacter sp. R2A056_3_33 TaxID=2745563 RepID=UPI001C4EFBF2|nr:twin-arginine translocase TatA/TatE family subunit [Polaribacter sp. R2A056_3_33]QXP71759.1 twin-arginine translocase TatA/TatE family subunit [Polaribacter sp. R2A056_3_33]
MNTILLFISGPEIMVVMLIVVMLFGADKIPEIAKGLGKGMRQVKDATNDIKREINESSKLPKAEADSAKEVSQGANQEFKNITKDINKGINSVKQDIEDLTGPIKRNF